MVKHESLNIGTSCRVYCYAIYAPSPLPNLSHICTGFSSLLLLFALKMIKKKKKSKQVFLLEVFFVSDGYFQFHVRGHTETLTHIP